MRDKRKFIIYGRSSSGKTAQIGVLAEHIYKTTGKKTRLYSGDRGGVRTIQPYIDLGIIEVEQMGEANPNLFLNNATKGRIRVAGKWVEGVRDTIGMYAFESMRAYAEGMMAWMAKESGAGRNIGGGSNIAFTISADGESMKVAGSNPAHYGVAQATITDEVWSSQKLPAQFILWTSSVSKDDDTTSSGKVLGPDVIGKALTAEVPRWFDLTFRMDVIPAQQGKPERHILYLGSHADVNAGNASALGNTRMALDAPPLTQLTVEPADLVKALSLIDGGHALATDVIRKRLNLK